MKNFILRTITGALYVAVILAGILLGAIPFWILCMSLGVLATIEYTSLGHLKRQSDGSVTPSVDWTSASMWIDVAMALTLITAGWMSMRYAYMQIWGTWLSIILVRLVYTLYSKE